MKVLVDTCIWSLALRRSKSEKNSAVIGQLTDFISDSLVQMIGPIRQEILSGIPSLEQFSKLRDYLSAFEDIDIDHNDYELAAEIYNTCKKNGIQGSNTDFLICAVALNHHLTIFTLDNDFTYFAKYVSISLV
jgi:predicted nucleic acid-binding protein